MGLKRRRAKAMLFEMFCSSDTLVCSTGDVYIYIDICDGIFPRRYASRDANVNKSSLIGEVKISGAYRTHHSNCFSEHSIQMF
jgi:hypothetical protein